MATPKELKEKFWDKLKSDRTMMLGLDGVEDGHARPMTAQAEGEHGPIWFFTSTDNALVQKLSGGDANFHDRAIATFVDKGHDVFATVHGALRVDTDRAVVDRLWNKFVAAWYEGGKDDPKLRLLRLDPESAEIWLNENSLFAGAKMLLGIDPKEDYKDKVANVRLS
jgi:general stress protein 26